MTERGQLATESQRNDMELLVDRLEELKGEGEPYNDESMVGTNRICYVSYFTGACLSAL